MNIKSVNISPFKIEVYSNVIKFIFAFISLSLLGWVVRAFCLDHNIAYHMFLKVKDNEIVLAPKYIKSNTPTAVLNTIEWKRSLICH